MLIPAPAARNMARSAAGQTPMMPISNTTKPIQRVTPPRVSARNGLKATRSRKMASTPAPTMATGMATHSGRFSFVTQKNAKNAPHIKVAPCARLTMSSTPKMRV